MNCAIIIPTLNPNEQLLTFIEKLKFYKFQKIVVIDDGSDSSCASIFEQLSSKDITILHHKKNLGKGAALKTGIRHLKDSDIYGFITADSDGQHDAYDVYRIACSLASQPNKLILGCRDFSTNQVPFKSKFGNRFSSFFFKHVTGLICNDTQTGLRGIPIALCDLALAVNGSRYDYEMNFLIFCAKSNIEFQNVPIKTIYENHNECSHFRPLLDSILIFKAPLKFTASSLGSAVVDVGVFYFLVHMIGSAFSYGVFLSNIMARCISGIFNFLLNRHWSFQSSGTAGRELFKYTLLFFTQMMLSSLLVTALSVIPIPIAVTKMMVDCLLFFGSYLVQKKLIFNTMERSYETGK